MEPWQSNREKGHGRLEDHGRLLARYQDTPALHDPQQPTYHCGQPTQADKSRSCRNAPFLRFPYEHMISPAQSRRTSLRLIHRSAWKEYSANFVSNGVLGSSLPASNSKLQQKSLI